MAEQSQTGPATIIISGIALGMKSTLWPVLTIGTAMILAYAFAGGFASPAHGLYGIGIAAVGMLSTLGITLATDAYGPIADNAGGNAEMSGQEPQVRERTDALDSLGNTTAATGKGFAIGSAALTALALIAAYIEEVRIGLERIGFHIMEVADGSRVVAVGYESLAVGANEAVGVLSETGKQFIVPAASGIDPAGLSVATLADFMDVYGVSLDNPSVLVGMFIGAMMAFFFCALTMEAVGRAAGGIVDEVRRQFREIAGLLEGKEGVKADYARCVSICTTSAQKEMILPAMMALAVPVITGLIFGVAGVMGLLAGGLATGFVLAIMMANAGGSWDNAKKYIEQGAYGGKGSDCHKAAVVGDTVGDPFKDTSGPSLNILIKLMSMVSVVFAGLIVSVTPLVERLPQLLAMIGL